MSLCIFSRSRTNRSARTILIALFVSVVLVACGGTSLTGDAPSAASPCSPADAPLAKVVNPATADEFSSCAVTTEAEFLSADWGVVVGGDVEGQVKWSAVVPGATEATDMKFMFIPKDKSDVIFTLKKGDHVRLTGSTSKTMVGQVIIYATSIAKIEGSAP